MANYKTHVIFNLTLFLPLTLCIVFYFFSPTRFDFLVYTLAFMYATCIMSPDIDMTYRMRLFSLRGILSLPFLPYSWLFAHRGMSHWLFIGTLTRIAWLALCFTIIYVFVYNHTLSFQPILHFYAIHKISIWYLISGFCISDLGHLILDRKK